MCYIIESGTDTFSKLSAFKKRMDACNQAAENFAAEMGETGHVPPGGSTAGDIDLLLFLQPPNKDRFVKGRKNSIDPYDYYRIRKRGNEDDWHRWQ